MDLHRMNKVLEVNEKFAYAVVEPGVTFGDLYTYCVEKKLKVWPSTASLGWGSVVGNVSLSSILLAFEARFLTISRPWTGEWASFPQESITKTSPGSR